MSRRLELGTDSGQAVIPPDGEFRVRLVSADGHWNLSKQVLPVAGQTIYSISVTVVALTQGETVRLLAALGETKLYVPAAPATTTGMREGEALDLRWRDVDLGGGRLQVRQTLQQAKGDLFFKAPKSERGGRSIALTPMTVETLRKHRVEQNGQRLLLGAAYEDQDLVLARDDGRPWHPGSFAAEWRKKT